MEEAIEFRSEGLRIEGALERGEGNKGVVISHPHPLHGGDMDNSVVLAIRRAYRRRGFSTLRYNFRGVGRSEGRFENGRGEKRDVQAALSFLAEVGATELDLAGYSFGAWVNAGITAGFGRAVMVSPPLAFIDFGEPAPLPGLHLVVTGRLDQIAPVDLIAARLPAWNPQAAFEVIDAADHFFSGLTRRLEEVIAARIG
jgi:hypothetical protein